LICPTQDATLKPISAQLFVTDAPEPAAVMWAPEEAPQLMSPLVRVGLQLVVPVFQAKSRAASVQLAVVSSAMFEVELHSACDIKVVVVVVVGHHD